MWFRQHCGLRTNFNRTKFNLRWKGYIFSLTHECCPNHINLVLDKSLGGQRSVHQSRERRQFFHSFAFREYDARHVAADYYIHDKRPAPHAWHITWVGVTTIDCVTDTTSPWWHAKTNTYDRIDILTHSKPHEFGVLRIRQKRTESSIHRHEESGES